MKQYGMSLKSKKKKEIVPKLLTMSGVRDNMGGKLAGLENRHGQDRQTLP